MSLQHKTPPWLKSFQDGTQYSDRALISLTARKLKQRHIQVFLMQNMVENSHQPQGFFLLCLTFSSVLIVCYGITPDLTAPHALTLPAEQIPDDHTLYKEHLTEG